MLIGGITNFGVKNRFDIGPIELIPLVPDANPVSSCAQDAIKNFPQKLRNANAGLVSSGEVAKAPGS